MIKTITSNGTDAPTDESSSKEQVSDDAATSSGDGPSSAADEADAASASKETDAPVEGNVAAADDTKEAIAEQSETAGGVIEWLDSMAVQIGGFRISIWDGTFVLSVIILTIFIAWIASHFTQKMLRRSTRLDPSQQALAQKLLAILIWSFAIMMGFDLLGVDLTALAVFSGAFGLAIGFCLQKTIGNFIAGIILLMDKSIKPGDIIAVADQSGQSTFGQIRKIGIRAVSITTRDQIEYLIPNENLMVNQVENWSYSSKRVRIQVPVGVSYDCDIHLAEELMMQAAKSCDRVLKTPSPNVWLEQFGESSVDFIIHCWISDPESGVGNVRSQVLKRLWDLFQENGVEIPFPQRDLNLRNTKQIEQLIDAIANRSDKNAD